MRFLPPQLSQLQHTDLDFPPCDSQAFLFGAPIQVNLVFDGEDTRKKIPVRTEKKGVVDYLLYNGFEPVKGKIELKVPPGKGVQHQGIYAELVGQIGVFVTDTWNGNLTLCVTRRGPVRPRKQL